MKFRTCRLILVLIVGVSLTITLGSATVANSKDPIPLGVLLPYTGAWAWVGAGADPGVDLAFKEIKDSGIWPADTPIKLSKEDTETRSKPAIAGARKLYDVDKVVGIVGPTSATVRSIIPISKEAGAAEISPTAGTTKLDTIGGGINGEYIFRTVSSDVIMTAGMAWYAKENFDPERVAIFTADTEGSRSIHFGVRDAAQCLDLNIVTEIEFPLGQESYRAELKKLFAKDPQVIFYEGSPDTDAVYFKQWYEMGLGGQFVGSDFTNKTAAKATLPASEGTIGVNPGVLLTDRTKAWTKRMEKLTGEAGRPPFSANAYDATLIFALAMERAYSIAGDWGTTTSVRRKAIINSLRKVAQPPGKKVYSWEEGVKALRDGQEINYEGMAGTQDWNKYGDPITFLRVVKMTEEVPSGLKRIGSVTPDDIKDVVDCVLEIRAKR